jgi:hypothetical protein
MSSPSPGCGGHEVGQHSCNLAQTEVKVTFAGLFFLFALLAVCVTAMVKGGQDERTAAIAFAVAAFVSPLVDARRFSGPAIGLILIDSILFVIICIIAMRSRSFWPMWAAGFQMCTLAGHLAAAKSPTMLPAAYADTLVIWSYAVMVTLALGTILEGQERHGRR